MREAQILQQSLAHFCPQLHAKRRNTLILACAALQRTNVLTLTALGRKLPGQAHEKHGIKRMDRLLGNHHLHQERAAVYQWHAHFLCSANPLPVILVDWADIREQEHLMVLRASVALKGRSITLYERTFPLKEHNTAQAHKQFLKELNAILPSHVTPLIVTDAGFRNPWFREMEKYGWFWLSRIRGRVFVAKIGGECWHSIRDFYSQPDDKPQHLGGYKLARKSPIRCQLYRYRKARKGRTERRSTRTACTHPPSERFAKSAREPWLLATNLPPEAFNAVQIVKLYSKRMQIEETFRDLKSPAYGFGLRLSRTHSAMRFDIMLLIALLLQFIHWLAGVYAQHMGWQRFFQANTVRNRNVLSTVRLGKAVLDHQNYAISEEDMLMAARLLAEQIRQNGCALVEL